MQDPRNVPVSCGDVAALEDYEGALRSFQIYFGDPVAQVDSALAQAPDFVLGHLFRATAFYLSSERQHLATAQASVKLASQFIDQANDRERMLYAAVNDLVAGRWSQAGTAYDKLLQTYPTDIFALQSAHLLDFFRGDALSLRNRPGRVLPEWDSSMPGYSYVLGMYAFGLEESNQYELAERRGRAALAIDPVDPWSVHAVTHVLEMLGRSEEGISFLEERESDWAPDNGFSFHNFWHLGLMYLERSDYGKVLSLLDEKITLDADESLVLLDSTAMLWRLRLLGVDVGDRSQTVADGWAKKIRLETGFYGFNDFHAALALAMAGRTDQLTELVTSLRKVHDNPQSSDAPNNVPMTTQVALPLVEAVVNFSEERFVEASQQLNEVRERANMFGGSHAQRDIISLTCLAAASAGGQKDLVRHLLNERAMLKPDGVLGREIVKAA